MYVSLQLFYMVTIAISLVEAYGHHEANRWEESLNEVIGPCVCVSPHQCVQDKSIFNVGGLIDPRNTLPCSMVSQVCCLFDNVLHNGEIQCGKRHSALHEERIISLQQNISKFGDWPWHAAILRPMKNGALFLCSGVLISFELVLTAAHCLTILQRNFGKDQLFVRLGEWDTQNINEPIAHRDYLVKRTIIHPLFDPQNLWNDIAILVLKEPVRFQPNISPVCLPGGTIIQTFKCAVTGWGKNANEGGYYSAILKETTMQIIEFHKCESQLQQTRLSGRFRLHPSFICAKGLMQNDSCKGDGGGPLVCKGIDGIYYLVGLVSWGIRCGNDVPGVYVNVGRFVRWIETAYWK